MGNVDVERRIYVYLLESASAPVFLYVLRTVVILFVQLGALANTNTRFVCFLNTFHALVLMTLCQEFASLGINIHSLFPHSPTSTTPVMFLRLLRQKHLKDFETSWSLPGRRGRWSVGMFVRRFGSLCTSSDLSGLHYLCDVSREADCSR